MSDQPRPKRRRIVVAPASSNPLLRTVQNVQCAEDEEVEWEWSETPEGRFVSGYRIVRAAPPVAAPMPVPVCEVVRARPPAARRRSAAPKAPKATPKPPPKAASSKAAPRRARA